MADRLRISGLWLLTAAVVLGVSGWASGVELTLNNPSFETGPMFGDEGDDDVEGWNHPSSAVCGVAEHVTSHPYWNTLPSDGTERGFFSNAAVNLDQPTAHVVQVGYSYILSVDMGQPDLTPSQSGIALELWVDGLPGGIVQAVTGFTPIDEFVSGEWIRRRVFFYDDGTYTGGTIFVRITTTAGLQPWVDAVSLQENLGYAEKVVVNPMAISAFENILSGPVTAEYSVVLNEAPESNVTISFASSDPNIAVPADITFHPEDWDTPQPVTVTVSNGVSDSSTKLVEITNTSQSSDGIFDGEIHVVELTVYNDDVPSILVDTSDGVAVDEEDETSDSYTVQLLSPPTAAVTVTPAAVDPTQLDIAEASLEFSVAAWYEKKTVNVSAKDDSTLEANPHQAVISHGAAGDSAYLGLTIPDVTVLIAENECGAWGYDAMDFDYSCDVNLADLALFGANWLNCTEPFAPGCVDVR